MENGKFIVFEGIDGSGKSTQMQKISTRLAALNNDVHTTFEPTKGPVGSLIRQMLSGEVDTDQRTIASLFAADRTDHLVNKKNGIRHKVDQGCTVLCDRYYFSSYAYHAQYIDMEWVIHANLLNAEILKPDVTIFIDVEPEICFERIKNSRSHLEMYENMDVMGNVRVNYFRAFDKLKDKENVAVVDGSGNVEQVEKNIWKEIKQLFIIE